MTEPTEWPTTKVVRNQHGALVAVLTSEIVPAVPTPTEAP